MNPLCHLLALSAHVPDAVLTNEDLARVVDTNDEWIVSRTGIRQRHKLADDENASDLGLKAARKALADAGVEILVCGTCLSFYGLTDQLQVGTVSNMYDIVTRMQRAAKVVSL